MDIEFKFYELTVIPGLYANGTAEISVRPDGVNDDPEWFIGKIYLHGENNKPCEVDDPAIYRKIYHELEHGCASQINDQIVSELLEGVA